MNTNAYIIRLDNYTRFILPVQWRWLRGANLWICLKGHGTIIAADGEYTIEARSCFIFNEAEEYYNKATELDEDNAGMYFSEFAMAYFTRAPIVMEKFLDDTTWRMIKKKSLTYMLKALDMDEKEAMGLLSD